MSSRVNLIVMSELLWLDLKCLAEDHPVNLKQWCPHHPPPLELESSSNQGHLLLQIWLQIWNDERRTNPKLRWQLKFVCIIIYFLHNFVRTSSTCNTLVYKRRPESSFLCPRSPHTFAQDSKSWQTWGSHLNQVSFSKFHVSPISHHVRVWAARDREHNLYISLIKLCRGCTLPLQVMIPICPGSQLPTTLPRWAGRVSLWDFS